MAKVYIISKDGSTKPMTPIYCKDESKELQDILEKNPDLIPGDQISPSDPRRWLSVKKEMPKRGSCRTCLTCRNWETLLIELN